ncbi:hypothetical protein FACS189435_3150 [Bacteroidia bacterium]|nr:hypothetical protein FACS189435_3150 [Bacteroidia bacterium]
MDNGAPGVFVLAACFQEDSVQRRSLAHHPFTRRKEGQPTALHVSAGAGYIYIKSESGVIGSLQVYDTVGKLVFGTANLNESQFKLPVNGKQMYIVKATVGEATVVEKIMPNYVFFVFVV